MSLVFQYLHTHCMLFLIGEAHTVTLKCPTKTMALLNLTMLLTIWDILHPISWTQSLPDPTPDLYMTCG